MSWLSGFEHFVRENEPLAPYTWLRLGGPARYFAEPTTPEELTSLVKRCHEQGITARMLGGGSNLVVSDHGVEGLVIHLTAGCFATLKRQGKHLVAGGGAKLAHLVSAAAREGFVGLEDLVGIPGTVGGALHGNAGGPHDDVGSWVRRATVVTRGGETADRSREEMQFSYRSSSLDELIILEAAFEMESGDPTEITKRLQRNWIVKRAWLPPAAIPQGYLFKDSSGTSASSIIEQAGLSGYRVGDAELSDHNANFVLIGRNATSADVRELIEHVRRTVLERTGAQLETAIEIW
jgi:UDP-N-acetylmuramate dehydrogenase